MADNSELTRPIIGIENRTAQEVFDIMADRIRRTPVPAEVGEVTDAEVAEAAAAIAGWFGSLDQAKVAVRAALIAARRVQPQQDAPSEPLEPLGAEFEKVWDDNVATLYEPGPKQDAPSPDVAGLIEALRHALVYIYSFRAQLRDPLAQTVLDEVAREGRCAIEAALSSLPKDGDRP